jgi:hypothetical protein
LCPFALSNKIDLLIQKRKSFTGIFQNLGI